ncbi:MAG: hypothetical protein BMS9Abin25_0300 [Gammaproteobacteria bacterium]|nr:MAG: hypothetical protein BMS9Abin25_0300 [Gammaproteobacteria bacterium]
MLDVMIKKNGQRADIEPYKWIFTEDGLPAAPVNPDKPRLFYVRLDGGRTERAYYKGAVLEKWLSESNTHIVINENDVIAWRYLRPK